jgi:hypothetical protein
MLTRQPHSLSHTRIASLLEREGVKVDHREVLTGLEYFFR